MQSSKLKWETEVEAENRTTVRQLLSAKAPRSVLSAVANGLAQVLLVDETGAARIVSLDTQIHGAVKLATLPVLAGG